MNRSTIRTFVRRRGRGIVHAALAALLVTAPAAVHVQAQERGEAGPEFRPLVTIKEVMEQTITPATNTIWNAYEPPSDEQQWVALEEAAVTLLVAAETVALGGAGEMDDEWARQPGWQAYNNVMIEAGLAALEAIRARDHDALLTAGDELYPPCEGCHQQFNPGVIGQR